MSKSFYASYKSSLIDFQIFPSRNQVSITSFYYLGEASNFAPLRSPLNFDTLEIFLAFSKTVGYWFFMHPRVETGQHNPIFFTLEGAEFYPLYFDPKFRSRLNLSMHLIRVRLLFFRFFQVRNRSA